VQQLAHEIIPQYNFGHKVKEESQNQKKKRGSALVGLWSSKGFWLAILKRSVVGLWSQFLKVVV
jgi:hypothetical protein